MGYVLRKDDKKYTYKDYSAWPDDEKWELIDGTAYAMSPAPSRYHQDISRELLRQFANYLLEKPCKVYSAPFDVRLPVKNEKDEDITTVVQPDLAVVCDKDKLDDKGCKGSPTLVIEIVSPETAQKDMKEKFNLYERVGVKEYWIIQPTDKTVMVFKLESNGRYGRPGMYTDEDEVKVGILEDLAINLKQVFA